MKFKKYQKIKIKNYFKNYSLLFIANGINQNLKNQMLTKQEMKKKLKLAYYKIYNKLTTKILKESICKNFTKLIYSPIFFLTPKQKNLNLSTIKYLETLSFTILGIKLNKKIYTITQFKNIKSTNYKNELSILYQFLFIHLKLIQTFRNNVI